MHSYSALPGAFFFTETVVKPLDLSMGIYDGRYYAAQYCIISIP